MFTLSPRPLPGATLNAAAGPANGPTLLLLHGVMRSWRSFAPLWPALLPRHHVVAADHRGHGGSSRGSGYSVRDYTADAIALVGSLPGPVTVYGHSLGAMVAAGVAAALPGRVRAVILEDPPSPAFLADVDTTAYGAVFRGMQRLAGTGAGWREVAAIALPGGLTLGDTRDAASLRLTAAMLRDVDPAALTPLIAGRWLEGVDWPGTLRGVRCPALLLRADDGRGGMLAAAAAEEMMGAMPDGLRVDFPGVGHLVHWLATDTLLRVVLAFLESL